MATADTLRKLALALPEVEEHPHHERASFRVRNKIFATLAEGERQAVVKLDVPHQEALVAADPETYLLVGWAHQGWTGIRLSKIANKPLKELVRTAWRKVAPKKLAASLDPSP